MKNRVEDRLELEEICTLSASFYDYNHEGLRNHSYQMAFWPYKICPT